jgi:hypothetical protein
VAERFQGFNPPIHTQTPNELFDVLLTEIANISELKVLLCAIRQTCGWHKEADTISLSQFMQRTGLSRQGVLNGIGNCLQRGTLERVSTRRHGYVYRLVLRAQVAVATSQQDGLVNEIDQSNRLTSQEPTSQQNRPPLVNRIDTQKKLKETEIKERVCVSTPLPPSKSQLEKQRRKEAIADSGGDVVVQLGDAYAEAKGINPAKVTRSVRAKWGPDLLEIHAAGFTAADVKLCIAWTLADHWWDDKTLTVRKVGEILPEWEARGKPGISDRGNGSKPRNQPTLMQAPPGPSCPTCQEPLHELILLSDARIPWCYHCRDDPSERADWPAVSAKLEAEQPHKAREPAMVS